MSFGQNKTVQKMHYFFFRELQLIADLLWIRNYYTSWSAWFIFLKLCGIFYFRFRLVFIKLYIFVKKKKHGLFYFKTSEFLSKQNNRKVTHSFVSRPLIFNLLQEIWKFKDIRVSWNSLKTDLETNFLNIENRSFEYVTFSQ